MMNPAEGGVNKRGYQYSVSGGGNHLKEKHFPGIVVLPDSVCEEIAYAATKHHCDKHKKHAAENVAAHQIDDHKSGRNATQAANRPIESKQGESAQITKKPRHRPVNTADKLSLEHSDGNSERNHQYGLVTRDNKQVRRCLDDVQKIQNHRINGMPQQ